MFYVNPENWSPFAPNGFAGVMKGVSAVFFAYIGFDALSTTAEECKNPRVTLPIAMIYSLVICTILYFAIALVLTGMVSINSRCRRSAGVCVRPERSESSVGCGRHRRLVRSSRMRRFSLFSKSVSRVSGWR